MSQEIQALLERTAELLAFVDYEQSLFHEDLARRELERRHPEYKQLVVLPVLQLPSKRS